MHGLDDGFDKVRKSVVAMRAPHASLGAKTTLGHAAAASFFGRQMHLAAAIEQIPRLGVEKSILERMHQAKSFGSHFALGVDLADKKSRFLSALTATGGIGFGGNLHAIFVRDSDFIKVKGTGHIVHVLFATKTTPTPAKK